MFFYKLYLLMKKFFLLLFTILLSFWLSFWYEQYWFSEYNEKSWIISFSCTNQCYVIIWEKWNLDYMKLQWAVNWNWTIAYWYIIWNEIALISQQNVFLQTQINESINFSDYTQYFGSISDDSNLILLLNWTINWDIYIDADVFSFWEKFIQWWKSFRKFDTFKPYTINLLYWPIINWKNANRRFYWIFIILFVVTLLIKTDRHKKVKILLIGIVSLRFLYDLRMWLEFINYYNDDYKNYISQERYKGMFRDRWNFYWFVNYVKDNIDTDCKNKGISFYTDNTRPFPWSMKYFLYPNKIVINENPDKCIIVYWSSSIKSIDNNTIEIASKQYHWKILRYADNAFIFINNK